MSAEPSLWSFITHASFVVQLVILILLAASIASWTIILNRRSVFRKTKHAIQHFNQRFWSGITLSDLYNNQKNNEQDDLAAIFQAGMQEYERLEQLQLNSEQTLAGTSRAMRIASVRESEKLEKHLTFLATVGSISPYVGLFGTVWGIMSSFQALGGAQQATIAMVAPGISEALIATAIGLFAAIPAVVAYNRFSNQLDRVEEKYSVFQEEMIGILQHASPTS